MAHTKNKKTKKGQQQKKPTPPIRDIDRRVFVENWMPRSMIGREAQVAVLKKTLANFQKYRVATNRVLEAQTGSGKTASIKFALKGYDENLYRLIECKSDTSIKTVLMHLAGLEGRNREKAAEIVKVAIKALTENKRILLVDDITALAADWVILMKYLDGINRDTGCTIIMSTNEKNFREKLPADVRNNLRLERVEFPAYDAVQLRMILEDRIEEAGGKGIVPKKAIAYIAARAGEYGSARDALYTVLRCIEENDYREEMIDKIIASQETLSNKAYLEKVSRKERLVLEFILKAYIKNGERTPITLDAIMEGLKMHQVRVTQTVGALEGYKIVTRKKRGKFNDVIPAADLVIAAKAGQLSFPGQIGEDTKK